MQSNNIKEELDALIMEAAKLKKRIPELEKELESSKERLYDLVGNPFSMGLITRKNKEYENSLCMRFDAAFFAGGNSKILVKEINDKWIVTTGARYKRDTGRRERSRSAYDTIKNLDELLQAWEEHNKK